MYKLSKELLVHKVSLSSNEVPKSYIINSYVYNNVNLTELILECNLIISLPDNSKSVVKRSRVNKIHCLYYYFVYCFLLKLITFD